MGREETDSPETPFWTTVSPHDDDALPRSFGAPSKARREFKGHHDRGNRPLRGSLRGRFAEGFSEVFRGSYRFSEVFRGFQSFSRGVRSFFRGFQRFSQRPSQRQISLSEALSPVSLIVLPLELSPEGCLQKKKKLNKILGVEGSKKRTTRKDAWVSGSSDPNRRESEITNRLRLSEKV